VVTGRNVNDIITLRAGLKTPREDRPATAQHGVFRRLSGRDGRASAGGLWLGGLPAVRGTLRSSLSDDLVKPIVPAGLELAGAEHLEVKVVTLLDGGEIERAC